MQIPSALAPYAVLDSTSLKVNDAAPQPARDELSAWAEAIGVTVRFVPEATFARMQGVNSGREEAANAVSEELNPVEEAIALLERTKGQNISDVHVEIAPTGATVIEFEINGDKEVIERLSPAEGERLRKALWSLGTSGGAHGSYSHNNLDANPFTTFTYGGNRLPAHLGMTRVQNIKTMGQVVVIRLVYQPDSGSLWQLQNLDIDGDSLAQIRRLCRVDSGGILVTGPVGQGKTTLVYAAMDEEIDYRISIGQRPTVYSIENPPERIFPRIRQIAVQRPEDWAAAIEAVLRGAAKMGFIGEARSKVELIGFTRWARVFKAWITYHARDTVTAFGRLREEGIPHHNLIDREVYRAIISMRLSPLLCPHCSTPWSQAADTAHHELTPLLRSSGLFATARRRGWGGTPDCEPACRKGIIGRKPIVEILENEESLARLILESPDAGRRAWLRQGGVSLGMRLVDLVATGQIDPEYADRLFPLKEAIADIGLLPEQHRLRTLVCTEIHPIKEAAE